MAREIGKLNRRLLILNICCLIAALALIVVNLIVLPRVVGLADRLRDSCETSNQSIRTNNHTLRADTRILLRQNGHPRRAAALTDAPLRDCATGHLITTTTGGAP